MSKKKNLEQKKKEGTNRLLVVGLCAIVFILVVGFFLFAWLNKPATVATPWSVDSAGMLNFTDRGKIVASSTPMENTANYTMEKIVYKSFGDDVYALLMIPKNVVKPPVVIVLPAATVTKEGNILTARNLVDMGYATLTLDERGNGGETTPQGPFEGDWISGLNSYKNNGDPVQYEQIYDALKGYDYVKTRGDLDGNNVAILGESIGGMWSIIAAAEEPKLKGVLCISSSDFSVAPIDDPQAQTFVNSVMPSRYLDKLPPRKLVMFHFTNDTNIPIQDGKALYDKAKEPKAWYQYNGSLHGLWDPIMGPDIKKELQVILGR